MEQKDQHSEPHDRMRSSAYVSLDMIRRLNKGFAERLGDPGEWTSALGYALVAFGVLENMLEKCIALLANLSQAAAPPLFAALSFELKVRLLCSLILSQSHSKQFNVGYEGLERTLQDITDMLLECGKLREKLINSQWSDVNNSCTSRCSKRPLEVVVRSEGISAGYIVDIADLFLNAEMVLDEFFIGYDDPPPGSQKQ